jgi:RNA polymerase sigma-70 factor (ECF subfamily)
MVSKCRSTNKYLIMDEVNNKTDFELIKKIQSGNKPSFKVLFDKYYTQMTKTAYLIVKDKDIAEEIVQEFFIKFWIKRQEININSSVKSYLFQSIRFRSLNYYRDNKRNNIESLEIIEINGSINNQIDDYDYDIVMKKLSTAIDTLPEKCKRIFLMSRKENLTYKQIAKKLELSQKTVENQMGIALKKLREKLKPMLQYLVCLLAILLKIFL